MSEYVERKKLEETFENADPDVCESDMDGHSDWGFGRENVKDLIRSVPTADVVEIESLKRLRDELCAQDLITLEGMRKLNTLIWKNTKVHDVGVDDYG